MTPKRTPEDISGRGKVQEYRLSPAELEAKVQQLRAICGGVAAIYGDAERRLRRENARRPLLPSGTLGSGPAGPMPPPESPPGRCSGPFYGRAEPILGRGTSHHLQSHLQFDTRLLHIVGEGVPSEGEEVTGAISALGEPGMGWS